MSIPIDLCLSCAATKLVVPVPTNGSNTIPSGGQVNTIGVLTKSSGNGAKCNFRPWVSSGIICHTSEIMLPLGL